jgi:(2Fe-2S) ferredoxin
MKDGMDTERSRPDDPALYFDAHVFVCTNDRGPDAPRTSCALKGAVKLRDYMKTQARVAGLDRVRINNSGCLDRCELGCNLVIYPEGVWYHYATRADLDEIIEVHLKGGGRVERLMLTPDQARLRPEQEPVPAPG